MKFFLDLEFRIGQSLSKVKETVKSIGFDKNLSKSSKDVKKGLDDVGKSAKGANKNLHHTSAGLKELQVDARNLNKSTAAANQTLFSFSDGLQDAAQFSQGFSQGMRAIGNNVAFTAELFSNLKVRVDQHNDAVKRGKIVNGQYTSVQDELKTALDGAGGMLIKLNVAVVAATFAFTALDKKLKKTTDAAKAQAEAIADVAKSFSDLDTGVEDPFGLRARAIEIGVLNDVIGDFDSKSAIDDYFETINRNVGGLALFSKAVLKVTSAFNDSDEEFLGYITKLEELQELQEGVVNTQRAYEQAIKDSRPELKEFIRITGDLEEVVLEQNTGIELTAKTLSELKEETEEVISVIGEKTKRDVKDISTLTRLQKLLSDINGFLDDNAKKRKKEQEDRTKSIDFFIKERGEMFINNVVLRKELSILQETDAFKRISTQEEIDRMLLLEGFRLRQIALIKQMDDAGVKGARRETLLRLLAAERDAELEALRLQFVQQRIDETLRQQAEYEAEFFQNQQAAVKAEEERIKKEEELQKIHNKAKRLTEETLAKDVSTIRTNGLKEFAARIKAEMNLVREKNKKMLEMHSKVTELMGRITTSQADKDFQNALKRAEIEGERFIAFADLKSQHDIMKADERTAAKLSIDKKYFDLLVSLGTQNLLDQDTVDQLSLMQADETSQAMADIDKKEKDAKIANAKGVIESISFITNGLFKDSKAGAIASAIMNTYEAATKALASAPPPFGQILMGGTIAAGMAQVKKIMSTKKGGGSGAGGASGGAGGGGGIGSRPRASGLFGTTETRGSANLNQPLFMPSGGMSKQSINVRVNNTFDDRTAATVVAEGNDHRREGAVSGLG
jgi:hypothetical protein